MNLPPQDAFFALDAAGVLQRRRNGIVLTREAADEQVGSRNLRDGHGRDVRIRMPCDSKAPLVDDGRVLAFCRRLPLVVPNRLEPRRRPLQPDSETADAGEQFHDANGRTALAFRRAAQLRVCGPAVFCNRCADILLLTFHAFGVLHHQGCPHLRNIPKRKLHRRFAHAQVVVRDLREVGRKIVGERAERAVRLERRDGLLHLGGASAEVGRARQDVRVFETRPVGQKRRLEHVIRLAPRLAEFRVGRMRGKELVARHLPRELRREAVAASLRVGVKPKLLDLREGVRVELVAVLRGIVVDAVLLDPRELPLLVGRYQDNRPRGIVSLRRDLLRFRGDLLLCRDLRPSRRAVSLLQQPLCHLQSLFNSSILGFS